MSLFNDLEAQTAAFVHAESVAKQEGLTKPMDRLLLFRSRLHDAGFRIVKIPRRKKQA